MSPWQRKLRRAIGSVKDQTTIGLAKVAGAMAPELEVALVKATSHDKSPVEEKHVQEVIFLTSTSRAYTMACVTHLSRRLSRTQNWIVAVKTLMLIHRLLKEGDYAFQDELFRECRAGGHVLNLSGFQDDSASCGWEYSAFVRTYALYLDELLDYNAITCGRALSSDSGRLSSSSTSSYGRRSGSETYGSVNEEPGLGWLNVPFKEMKPPELLERMPPVQRMLEHVLACHPAGAARMDRLIQNALDCIVRDSFLFYETVRDGLAALLDSFFEMEEADCSRAFEIQTVAAKQAEALIAFYGCCKGILSSRSSEYPFVQKIPEEVLETMEAFLRDLVMKRAAGSKDLGRLKALPAPPLSEVVAGPSAILDVQQRSMELSLLVLDDDARATNEQEKSLTLSSFTPPMNTSAWQTFFDNGEMGDEKSANGWELSLVTASSSETPMPFSTFIPSRESSRLLMSRFPEQMLPLSFPPLDRVGSLMTPDHPLSSLLALPAPNTPPQEDPFVASTSIPPPPYVHMSDMKQKQVLLLQEQMRWETYQREGAQGHHGLPKSYDSQLDGVFQPFSSVTFLQ